MRSASNFRVRESTVAPFPSSPKPRPTVMMARILTAPYPIGSPQPGAFGRGGVYVRFIPGVCPPRQDIVAVVSPLELGDHPRDRDVRLPPIADVGRRFCAFGGGVRDFVADDEQIAPPAAFLITIDGRMP